MSETTVNHHRFEQRVLGRLREIFDEHPWLITTEYLQGSVGLAGVVRDLTEQPVMAVGAAEGAGGLPTDPSFDVLSLGMGPGKSMVDTMHRGQALLADPEPKHQAVVDSWDPDHSARAIASFTSVAGHSMGRRTFGARPESWRELEDKLSIESIWAAAGIPVAPSQQVSASDRDGALAAHDDLAGPTGTVWAGDNNSGWHGGGAGTFWVPDQTAAESLCDGSDLDGFDRIRVMPFVDGVPCSMHGMVVPDGAGAAAVITFRPCEMLVLRDRLNQAFVYCRSATFWDPEPFDRAAMVTSAERIGHELIDRVDYRGVFTVDGVMGADGFVPTEVNTRYGAALRGRHPTESGELLNLVLLNMALIERRFDDVDLRQLGIVATAALDQDRHGHAFLACPARPEQERTAEVRRDPGGQLVLDETAGDSDHTANGRSAAASELNGVLATVQWTTMGADGGVINVTAVNPPVGPPFAPLLAETIELADQQWSLGVVPLEPAVPVR